MFQMSTWTYKEGSSGYEFVLQERGQGGRYDVGDNQMVFIAMKLYANIQGVREKKFQTRILQY